MNWPKRYREEESAAGRLFQAAAPVEARDPIQRQRDFRKLEARLTPPSSWRWMIVPSLVAVSLGLLVFVWVNARPLGPATGRDLSAAAAPVAVPAPPIAVAPPIPAPVAPEALSAERTIDLGTVGSLSLSAEAEVQLPSGPATAEQGYVVKLARGRMCAAVHHRDLPHEGPFIVEAPRLKVTVIGTRFCVESSPVRSTVEVSEGRVRVDGASGKSTAVSAGQAVASDGPELSPVVAVASKPSHKVPASVSCTTLVGVAAREECYRGRLDGDDVAAQEALFSLAVLARDERHDSRAALSHFRAYLAKFPNGVFAPEASQGALLQLMAASRYREAVAAADDYLQRFPSEARAGEVALLRARIFRDNLQRPGDALAAYQTLSQGGVLPPVQKEEAQFSIALCQARLGRTAEARTSFTQYLAEFPQGAHAAEARAHLAAHGD